MEAALYARFSSDNQREESIDAQIRAIKEYADQHDIEIVAQYTDEALSATTDNRPGFLDMIEDSKEADWDAVIVHKLDRFSRNRYDSAIYKKKLQASGVRVISVLENIDGSPESIILESVIEGYNEYYSKNLARETMKGMRENAYACKHTGGSPPLGYDVTENLEYVINPYEAEAVRIIFDMYTKGFSYPKIIDRLNEGGYRTKAGNAFRKNSLYDILRNEKYSGVYVFGRASAKDHRGKRNNRKNGTDIIRIEGGMPAIIDADTFDQARYKMQQNKHQRPRQGTRIYLLTGMIRCGICGRPMVSDSRVNHQRKSKYYYYVCSGKKNEKSCSARSINADKLEANIMEMFTEVILTSSNVKRLAEGVRRYHEAQHGSGGASPLQEELATVQQQIDRAVDAILGGVAVPAIKERLQDLEERKTALEAEIRKATKQTPPSLKEIEAFVASHMQIGRLTREEQKAILEQYIEQIMVSNTAVTVRLRLIQNDVAVTGGGGAHPTTADTYCIDRVTVGF